jgi:hypothetical protein
MGRLVRLSLSGQVRLNFIENNRACLTQSSRDDVMARPPARV